MADCKFLVTKYLESYVAGNKMKGRNFLFISVIFLFTYASTTLSRETATTTQLSSVSSTSTTTYLSTTATSPAILLRSLLSSKSETPQSKASLSTPSTLSSTTKYLPSKTTQRPSTSVALVSPLCLCVSSLGALNSSNEDSLQGKIHLTADDCTVRIQQNLFVMEIHRVLENNTNPFTCSTSNGTESIIIPSENLKGQDTVTVCTFFHDEIKQWIPNEKRIELNGETIMKFTLSNIIGSTVDPRPQDDVLQKNVTVILLYQGGLEVPCVFWDFTAKRSNFNGSWSRKGCSVVNRTKTEITCIHSFHPLKLPVLVHVGVDNEVPADHQVALKVITYVGCALSLIGEALTAVAYYVLMDLKEDQTQIRFNLVVAIAIAQITFLAGIDATEVKELCVFVAAMIHYFYLVGFAWMLFEGVYLYLMVVKVFNTVIRLRLFYGVAWGVSLLIVVLSIVTASIQDGGIENYVQDHFCWVSFKNNLIWTFVAPVLLVCMINSVILARVVHEILRMQADKTSHLERVRQGVKACVVLFPLLGLTWVFGVLSVTDAGLVFQYIFTIFNSLQGLFIFILHVLRNSDVRAAYSRKMQKRNAAKSVKNSQDNRNTIRLGSNKVTNEPSCTKGPSSASLRSWVGVTSKIDNALYQERTMTPVDT